VVFAEHLLSRQVELLHLGAFKQRHDGIKAIALPVGNFIFKPIAGAWSRQDRQRHARRFTQTINVTHVAGI